MADYLSTPGADKHFHLLSLLHAAFLATAWQWIAFAIGLAVASLIGYCLYNLFLHPLRHLPGPKLRAMTRIPFTLDALSGFHHQNVAKLHATYGPIVRSAPNVVSIRHPDATKDSRGHRNAGHQVSKDPVHWAAQAGNILGEPRDQHARFRRTLSHAFSASAMLEQEPFIRQYVDKLLTRLVQQCGGAVDITRWYNYCTFDIVGDLSFGEPFGCLDNAAYHPWVDIIFSTIKETIMAAEFSRYGLLGPLLSAWAIPKEIRSKLIRHKQLSREKVRKRLEMDTTRPDFIQKMLQGSRKGEDVSSSCLHG